MATPQAVTDTGSATTSGATPLQVAACCVLAAVAVLHLLFVIPTFAAWMVGLGASFSAPTRVALGIGSYGWLPGVLLVAGLGALYVRARRAPQERARFDFALAATTLALAAYVAVLSWAYIDVARALPASL
jgi:type II secretory pathway component PulF